MPGSSRFGIVSCVLALAIAACAAGDAKREERFAVKVIAFNDFHGNLQSPGSFGGAVVGGGDYLAAHVARLKAANPMNVVVAAGDLVGATPLVSALF
ncbi:MAG TPA: hypothetical protein VFV90_13485, partial [Usitatibacter sp.]|nr:hypothetical protein [Usitatibacter sp.]